MGAAYYRVTDLIGESRQLERLRELIGKIASADGNLLILGESGSGKELIAQAVHNASKRASGPFIALNCGAIPRELIESELFGYAKGAFTGAQSDRSGKFELAEGGSIFLDEIGELPYDMQSKLLRVLEERRFYPVGAERETRVNFRLICASNRDLAEMVKKREFREDLFFRLNNLKIIVPPLRDRPGDIPVLMDFFLKKYREKLGRPWITGFAPSVLSAYKKYGWPGNVRELENLVEREVVFTGCDEATIQHVSEQVTGANSGRLPSLNLAELEKTAYREALLRAGSNDEAAMLLGVSKATFYRKLKELSLDP
ncbi:MAG: sigma 54-interacting transcriptional regulator [Candidatus Wallbacteria bacterium]|nr:sigma 54-interacting transcriptional regulator [Candidatus Wallbacteria bacterium]